MSRRTLARFVALTSGVRPDTTAPTLEGAFIDASGDTLALVFSERVNGHDGFSLDLSGGAADATYSSGEGSNTLLYSLSRTIAYDEIGTVVHSFVDVMDLASNELADFTGFPVTNNVSAPDTTLLASFDITDPLNIDSFTRAGAAGFTGNGDADEWQREAAADTLRDSHYVDGEQCVILEDTPTACALVAVGNLVATGDEEAFGFSHDDVPVTASRLRFDYRLLKDSDDSVVIDWTSNGTNLSASGVSASADDYYLEVRAVSTSGVAGSVATSASFTVTAASGATFSDDFSGGAQNPIAGAWTSGPGNYIDMARTSGGKAEGTGGNSAAYVNTPTFSGDQMATVTMDGSSGVAPLVRGQSGSAAAYIAYATNATTVTIYKKDASLGVSQIGSDITVPSMGSGTQLSLEVTGAGTLNVYTDGSFRGTATDSSSPLSGGQPGMYSNGFGAFLEFSATDV